MRIAASDLGYVNRPLFGIFLKIVSVIVFVFMSSMIKASEGIPLGQVVFFRSSIALVPIFIMLLWNGEFFVSYKTKNMKGHFWRGFVGCVSMAFGFVGLTHLPLPDAVTLNYAQPLLVVVLSALFFGEIVRAYRWSAVVVGFLGVLIIAWPSLTLLRSGAMDSQQVIGVVAIMLGASSSALVVLLVRQLVLTERTSTIVLWFSLYSSMFGLMTLPFGWVALSFEQAMILIGAGLFGGVGQILMTASYRYAEASTIAPFEYTSIILAIIIGYVIFDDVPTLYMLIGGAVVVGAGLFIIWRERQLGKDQLVAGRFVKPGG